MPKFWSESSFDVEHCLFNIRSDSSTSTSGYSAGDIIPLRTKFGFTPEIYGHWEEDNRRLYRGYVQCGSCMKCFSDFMLGIHSSMEQDPGGCWGNYLIGMDYANPTTWVFVSDKTPCKIVLKYMFPDGVSYKDGSIRVYGKVSKKDCTDSCIINLSENELTVTIDDIKAEPFHTAFKYEEYKKDLYYKPDDARKQGFRDLVVVEFDTDVDSNLNSDNVITSTMSYSYKDTSHTDTYEISVRSASLQVSNTDAGGNNLSGAEFELYQIKTKYREGSNYGLSDWSLLKSGIHAGDIITALGTGTNSLENEYRIIQTKAPDGYEPAYPVNFELFIDEDGTVRAKDSTVRADDSEGDELTVENGVVQVNVVNASKNPGSGNTAVSGNTAPVNNVPQTTDSGASTNTSVPNTSTSSGRKLVKVKATYYKDGVKECSMTYQQSVEQSETMMDRDIIRDRAYKFEGCRLDKLTLNGVEVDSLPYKVEDKSEVCFYYVSH